MFDVKITGFNGLEAKIKSASASIQNIVAQEVESAAKDWVAGSKRDAPKDQGALSGSISYTSSGTNSEIFAQKFYAPFVEFGTKGKYQPIPGTENIVSQFKGYKGGDLKEFFKSITRWVHRKGIAGTYSVKTRRRTGSKATQTDQNERLAWAIMLSILKNGISPHPFFFKQAEIVWPKMVANIEKRLRAQSVSVIMPSDMRRPKIITV